MVRLAPEDLGDVGSSEVIASLVPGARLVKAFNSITMAKFVDGPTRGDATRVLLVSSDDEQAKRTVMEMIEGLGFAAIDLGGLKEGGRRQQAGSPSPPAAAGAMIAHTKSPSPAACRLGEQRKGCLK